VVRSIGSDLHMDYTAVGQTTHLAARLEHAALPGSILVSLRTMQLAEGYIQVRPLGPIRVKGLAAAVDAYEVTGTGVARTRLQAAAARGLTRFVGRDAELAHLGRALERAGSGQGQVVAVAGEPGVGKSRLFYEFTHSHRMQGWLVLESGSVSYGKATAYLPVVDLLKAYFRAEDGDDQREIREKVIGKLLTLDRSLEPGLPAILALLDVPIEDPQWKTLDPAERRHRTLAAVKGVLLRESQVQPVLAIFDDLHWIDSESQAFLDGLVESLPTARIFLLVNYRPEYRHGWGSKTYYAQIRLDPLSPPTAGELLQALVGDDPGARSLKSRLIERTEGNPFFLEESVQALVETGVLVGERGAYRPRRPAESIQVPPTVQAVLAARIDRLPSDEKRLLQSAAVIGKDVPLVLWQAIAEVDEEVLRHAVIHLQGAEFLYETRILPDVEYTFKHALTHEVAYASLLTERRRALHGRIVEAIERCYSDRLTEHVDRLAHHSFRGELWEKAVGLLRQAGNRAATRSAFPEAVAWLEQALVALGHLPEGREVIEQAVDVRFDLQAPLTSLAAIERMLGYLREAHTLAGQLDDQHRLGRVAAYMTFCFWFTGNPDEAVVSALRALSIASTLGDLALEVLTNYRLGQTYMTLGEYPRAIERLARTVELVTGEPISERFGMPGLPAVAARTVMTFCFQARGNVAAATAAAEEACRLAELVNHPYSRAFAYHGIGTTHLFRGDLAGAIHWLEQSLDFCRRSSFPFVLPQVAAALGGAYALSGRLADGIALLQHAVEETASVKLMSIHPRTLASLGEAYLLAGRRAEALQAVGRALELTRTHKQHGFEAEVLRILGDIYASGDIDGSDDRSSVEKAETSYQGALALATELGMRPVTARCHLGLGRLYRRAGRRHESEVELTTAATMLREMNMRWWLAQAEAELGHLTTITERQ
jgi:tetratricopeptide (TPR) repeat protein